MQTLEKKFNFNLFADSTLSSFKPKYGVNNRLKIEDNPLSASIFNYYFETLIVVPS